MLQLLDHQAYVNLQALASYEGVDDNAGQNDALHPESLVQVSIQDCYDPI